MITAQTAKVLSDVYIDCQASQTPMIVPCYNYGDFERHIKSRDIWDITCRDMEWKWCECEGQWIG